MSRRVAHASLAAALTAVWLLGTATAAGSRAAPVEVRGLWVTRASLTSPASIARMVQQAKAAGINTLFVQVRGRGEAFYRSRIEPRASELATMPASFDPLAETLARAHEADLRVHAWVNVNLVASASWLPQAESHVVRRHPEWLMAPRALAVPLANRSPRAAGYLTELVRWTAGASARVEGLFLSPLVPAAQDHSVAVVKELAGAYAIDGLHLDYIRFPGPDFDYAPAALTEFRRLVLARGVTASDRQRLDGAARRDPAIWTRTYPASWSAFREGQLTRLVARLRAAALEALPGVLISAAVLPDPARARADKLQDWGQWADAGHLDAVCPMIYTTDAAEFVTRLDAVRARLPRQVALWAGIGAYRLPPAETAANVHAARQRGAAGVLLFSYEQPSVAVGDGWPVLRDRLRSALMDPADLDSR